MKLKQCGRGNGGAALLVTQVWVSKAEMLKV